MLYPSTDADADALGANQNGTALNLYLWLASCVVTCKGVLLGHGLEDVDCRKCRMKMDRGGEMGTLIAERNDREDSAMGVVPFNKERTLEMEEL